MSEEKKEGVIVSMWIDKSLLARVDKLAVIGGLSRSRLLQNVIGVSVDELELMKSVGALATALVLRDLHRWFGKKVQGVVSGELFKA